MRGTARVFAAGLMLFAAAQAGQAQEIRFGPGGISIIPPGPPPGPPPAVVREEPPQELISRPEAREIALSRGMVEIRSVDRDDFQYEVRGEDDLGRRMRVTIDGRNGRVVEVVRREGGPPPGPPPGPAFDRGPGPDFRR
jgi:uncharacterized membrane protein YkoI